jgi:hypothetical protein
VAWWNLLERMSASIARIRGMPFTSLDSYILVFQTPERGFSGAGVLLQQGVKNSSRQLSAKSAAAIKSMCNKQDAFSAAGRARAKGAVI